MGELRTFVIYDIQDDRIRNRLGETCKDYGLSRIQYSGFMGSLSRNMREELCLKLRDALGEKAGKILVLPICEKDARAMFSVENAPPQDDGHKEDTGTDDPTASQ